MWATITVIHLQSPVPQGGNCNRRCWTGDRLADFNPRFPRVGTATQSGPGQRSEADETSIPGSPGWELQHSTPACVGAARICTSIPGSPGWELQPNIANAAITNALNFNPRFPRVGTATLYPPKRGP